VKELEDMLKKVKAKKDVRLRGDVEEAEVEEGKEKPDLSHLFLKQPSVDQVCIWPRAFA
jgi:hypothetical protein